jgi:hypothetical protein
MKTRTKNILILKKAILYHIKDNIRTTAALM